MTKDIRNVPDSEAAAVWEPIKALQPWSANPRDNKAAIDEVAKSIRRFGWGAPIVANKRNGEIIAGHTRYAAAQKLKLEQVPVRWLDLDPADAHALALADNKVGEVATWDDATLRQVLAELKEADESLLADTGFSDEELARLLGDVEPTVLEPEGESPEVDEAGPAHSELGELYELGPHLLLCGSALDVEWIERFSRDADAVVTDPPYGTGINAASGLGNSTVPMQLMGDENPELARLAVRAWLERVMTQVWWGANYYADALPGSPCWIVWDKDHHGMTFADAELAFVKSNKPVRVFRHAWSGMHRASERNTQREHPTQKPIELYKWTFDQFVPAEGIVVDPFGGSGSSLIACAETGRKARLIELDPRYCDVIRRRWTRWAKANNVEAGSGALDG